MTGKNKWKTREFRAASQNIKVSFLKFMFIDENIFSICCTIRVKSGKERKNFAFSLVCR